MGLLLFSNRSDYVLSDTHVEIIEYREGFLLRFAAKLIDTAIGSVVFSLLTLFLRSVKFISAQPTMKDSVLIIMFGMFANIMYYFISEYLTGMTIGKTYMGLRVVKKDGTKADFFNCLIRNIVFTFELYLLWIPSIIGLSQNSKRSLGDRISGTMVVNCNCLKSKNEVRKIHNILSFVVAILAVIIIDSSLLMILGLS